MQARRASRRAVPPGLERTLVTFGPNLEPPREEWFLPGTAVTEMLEKTSASAAASIVYPADGQIIALDPDIPTDSQRVQFEAQSAPAGSSWQLDGGAVAGTDAALWPPALGRHRLALLDALRQRAGQCRVRGARQPRSGIDLRCPVTTGTARALKRTLRARRM